MSGVRYDRWTFAGFPVTFLGRTWDTEIFAGTRRMRTEIFAGTRRMGTLVNAGFAEHSLRENTGKA